MRGRRLRYAAAIAALLVSAALLILRPLIVGVALDHIIQGKQLTAPGPAKAVIRSVVEWLGGRSALARNLWIASFAIVAVTSLSGLFMYLKGRWSAQAAESIARDLRERLYDRLQHVPCRWHDETPTGDLVQRCTSDVETVRMFLAMQLVDMVRGGIMLAVMTPVLFALDVRMALTATCLLPIIVVMASVFFMKVRSTFLRMDEAEGRMTAMLQENLTGVRVVRAFGRQEHECDRFSAANGEYRDRWYRLMKLMSYYWPVSEFLCIAQRGLVLLIGGYYVAHGRISMGTLYIFFTCVRIYIWPVQQMGRILSELGKALVSVGRIKEVLEADPEPDPPTTESVVLPSRAAGRIEFENVGFSHPGSADVLRDVSLTVEPGDTVAILGPSGAGKTTLVSLLMRLYDYDAGSIRLDGIDLRHWPRKHVRSQIGAVLQEPFLYSRSLRDNIRLGRSASRDEEIVEAASAACIHESILSFDKGYDTAVGERGVTLSGGQRQRVALARALLRNPPILVLDDALSAVDTRTESLILRALTERRGRHTTLVIAHRLTTLMNADHIVLLTDGQVVQAGTHSELIDQPGAYRSLWKMQTSLEDDPEGAAGEPEQPMDPRRD
jgi:ATP-binding cassette, subfamily B, bacterial